MRIDPLVRSFGHLARTSQNINHTALAATTCTLETSMITTAPRAVALRTALSIALDVSRTPTPHDMSCACCGHGLHVHLGCGDGCDCGPQVMPGTAA